jgi:hypothetical protein
MRGGLRWWNAAADRLVREHEPLVPVKGPVARTTVILL